MRQRFTLAKAEKLKSRKRIERVFKEGRSLSVFPFKVFYLLVPPPPTAAQPIAAATSAANSIDAINPFDAAQPTAAADPIAAAQPTSATNPIVTVHPISAVHPIVAVHPIATVSTAPLPHPSPSLSSPAPLQAGFGAGSRHFKKAVDRNRIKRLSREAYRLQKQPLMDALAEKKSSMALFFIYTGKELPDHGTVKARIGVLLQKLIKEIK